MTDHDQPAEILPAPPIYPLTATQAARNLAGIARARQILDETRPDRPRARPATAANVCPTCGRTLPER